MINFDKEKYTCSYEDKDDREWTPKWYTVIVIHVTVSSTIINKKKYLYLSDHAVWSTQLMTLPGI